jgi:nucleoside-diphosphate-sugar epimerase
MSSSENSLLASYENRRVLITGGTGYIGSSLVRALQTVPCQVVLLVREGRSVAPGPDTVANISIISGDIRACETWSRALEGVDYVFHLAAQTSAYIASEDPFVDLDINVLPVLHMLETCRERNLPAKIVFAGTVTEVGITLQTPVDESFADHPVTIYDIHKLTAEKYLQYYARQTATETVTLRLPNVYGPGPSSSHADRGVLNQMVRKALRGEALTVYGEGAFVRDYVFIDDVVRAFLVAGSKIDVLSGNYYVIGSGTGTRFVDAVNLVADRVTRQKGHRPSVVHITPPDTQLAIEERNFVANTARFSQSTGWAPQSSLLEGIDRTTEYFLGQMKEVRE